MMVDVFTDIGFARWPLVSSFGAILGLTSYSAVRLFGRGALADPRTKALVNSILLWGAFATVAGVLSTFGGDRDRHALDRGRRHCLTQPALGRRQGLDAGRDGRAADLGRLVPGLVCLAVSVASAGGC